MIFTGLNATGETIYFKAEGEGTQLVPFVVKNEITNFPPAITEIAVNNLPATQGIIGIVSVNNLPETQSVVGSVAVVNLPETQPVSGAFFPATQSISAEALPLPVNASTEPTLVAVRDRLIELAGYVDGLESSIATLLARTPALGATTAANATPVTLSLDGAFATNFGAIDSLPATSDTGAFSLVAFIKRLFSKLPSALANDRLKVENSAVSTPRVTSFISTSTTGTIAAGANSVTIANSGNAAGTVKGVSLPAGASVSWGANGNDTLDSVAYVATGSTFLITTVT